MATVATGMGYHMSVMVCRLSGLGKTVQSFNLAGWAALVALAGATAWVSLGFVDRREGSSSVALHERGSPAAAGKPTGRTDSIHQASN